MISISSNNSQLMIEVNDHSKPIQLLGNYMVLSEESDRLRMFPSGHFFESTLTFDRSGRVIEHISKHDLWLNKPAIKTYMNGPQQVDCVLSQESSAESDKPCIILNCLDAVYGHALYKLLNVAIIRERYPDHAIVVLVHEALRYLVPDFVAELWLVKGDFTLQNTWIQQLEPFVMTQLSRFSRSYLWMALMSFDVAKLDLQMFTKVAPLPFDRFADERFTITYVLREDRFWLTTQADYYAYLAMIKFGLTESLQRYFLWRQTRNFNHLTRYIKRQLPDAIVQVAGLGKSGNMTQVESDRRVAFDTYVKNEDVRCKTYASSHLTVGVLGSHMLMPAYLSGGFISLVPPFKIRNYGEDYLPRPEPAQRSIFTSRFIDQSVGPKRLAQYAVGMLTGARDHGYKPEASSDYVNAKHAEAIRKMS